MAISLTRLQVPAKQKDQCRCGRSKDYGVCSQPLYITGEQENIFMGLYTSKYCLNTQDRIPLEMTVLLTHSHLFVFTRKHSVKLRFSAQYLTKSRQT